MRKPLTPEDAQRLATRLVQEGRIRFADDTLVADFDEEIQLIQTTVMRHYYGSEGLEGFWTSDEINIGVIFSSKQRRRADKACAAASQELGIEFTLDTLWVDAAAALRDLRSKQPKD